MQAGEKGKLVEALTTQAHLVISSRRLHRGKRAVPTRQLETCVSETKNHERLPDSIFGRCSNTVEIDTVRLSHASI